MSDHKHDYHLGYVLHYSENGKYYTKYAYYCDKPCQKSRVEIKEDK